VLSLPRRADSRAVAHNHGSICMEKGRTYFKQDVDFMHEMEFDTVKIDQCGSAMNMSLWAALINATGRPMMLENCHNAPSWWSPGPDAASVCDSNMWRSGGDIGNGFNGALSEAHQWFQKNNLSAAHPWGAKPISRPGCWGYPECVWQCCCLSAAHIVPTPWAVLTPLYCATMLTTQTLAA
jgi:hypothetical protein